MKKIELNNISVSYITGDFSTTGLKDVIIQKLKRTYVKKEFLALQGITFSLEQGELLGIIGTNGAGKSTLCKVISGIMRPTEGTMSVKGSIASLLELGTGFDPDLTVKENAFLRGALLGYTRDFMNKTYDSIIEFAELKEFEDRKFSHLSSGMKSRLAFSIACLVNPEILILDEVLSVGDGAFRKKSEAKMLEVIQGGATTILVSHSLAQIRRMATKVLWIEKGKQIDFGETEEICDKYEEFLNSRNSKKGK
ncbi:MAG: ABC transporter ATP-binding protein [Ruminococcus sp.]|nr:ABC transporter ATP-binding protein [Ruminococcus sp.]